MKRPKSSSGFWRISASALFLAAALVTDLRAQGDEDATGQQDENRALETEASSLQAVTKPIGPKPMADTRGQDRQRIAYLALQFPMSTALYGGALPWALGTTSLKTQIATPLLVAPFAFGAHLWFSRTRPFTQAHNAGTSYLSMAGLYAGFALPASLIDDADTRWRTAAWTSMALYPLSVYGGYVLGDVYASEPERIAAQARFALGFGLLGFFTPLLYFDDFGAHQEAMWRIGLVQSVGLAGMGHFISRYDQVGPYVPGGVNLGLLSHTLLGMASGLTVSAIADASSPRPWIGGAVLGGTLAFMEGLWFFHESQDSRERGLFSMLGGGAGALAGFGMTLLTWDSDASAYSQRVTTASLLAGGTLLGYVATYALTKGMVEPRRQSHRESEIDAERRRYGGVSKPQGWTWTWMPVPVITPEKDGEKTVWHYAIPGLIAKF